MKLTLFSLLFVALNCCITLSFGQTNSDGIYADFSDPVVLEIMDATDRRATDEVIAFLKHSDSKYRLRAVMGCCSLRDSKLLPELSPLLNDGHKDIRTFAAFAIGQQENADAIPVLSSRFGNEGNRDVRSELLVAMVKCATEPEHVETIRQNINLINDISEKIALTSSAILRLSLKQFNCNELMSVLISELSTHKYPLSTEIAFALNRYRGDFSKRNKI